MATIHAQGAFLLVCALSVGLSLGQAAAQDSLTLAIESDRFDIDLSDLDPPNADTPYVTLETPITIGGSLSDPQASISVSVTGEEGLYLQGYEIDPFQGALPAQTKLRILVNRASEVGSSKATIRASSGQASSTVEISLIVSRETITVSVLEPADGENFKPGEYSIRGRVDPPVEGVIVHLDLFHKYPELKTQEQLQGLKSGIRYNGLAVTKADGTFAIQPSTVAFQRGFGTMRADEIEGGVWYIHYYTRGQVLYGENLDALDHDNPQQTVGGGVKTFETEYEGVPDPPGSEVPESQVRKSVLNAFPAWFESIPALPDLTRPFLGMLPSEALPYAPYAALLIVLILALVVVRVVVKAVRKEPEYRE